MLEINSNGKINHSVSDVITSTFCSVMTYIESKIVALISDDFAEENEEVSRHDKKATHSSLT